MPWVLVKWYQSCLSVSKKWLLGKGLTIKAAGWSIVECIHWGVHYQYDRDMGIMECLNLMWRSMEYSVEYLSGVVPDSQLSSETSPSALVLIKYKWINIDENVNPICYGNFRYGPVLWYLYLQRFWTFDDVFQWVVSTALHSLKYILHLNEMYEFHNWAFHVLL